MWDIFCNFTADLNLYTYVNHDGALLLIINFAIFPNLLPDYDTIKAIKGAEPVELVDGVMISAQQLADAGIQIDKVTEKASGIPISTVDLLIVVSTNTKKSPR